MKHTDIEVRSLVMTVLVTLVILIGGLVEIVPLYFVKSAVPPLPGVKPYTALELEGRDIYVREGCYTCHSQVVRPFRDETERYGPYSKAGEFVYDRPFQWGSRRIGPDLQRVGGKYPDSWHYVHMNNPRDIAPESIMPAYPWILTNKLDTSLTVQKLKTMQRLGVPYTDEDVANAQQSLTGQAAGIQSGLARTIPEAQADTEIVALIAYLQKLGADINWRNQP